MDIPRKKVIHDRDYDLNSVGPGRKIKLHHMPKKFAFLLIIALNEMFVYMVYERLYIWAEITPTCAVNCTCADLGN